MPVVNNFTALLSGSYWGGIEVAHTPVIVTYSFSTTATEPTYPVDGFTGSTLSTFQEFSDAEKTQARTALGEWAAASSIVFVEVAPGHGDLNFQLVDFSTTTYGPKGGVGFYPFGDWNSLTYPYFHDGLTVGGDIFMNSDFETGSGSGEQVDYGTLLHEIGHAIGLKHPTEVVTDLAANPPVTHDAVLNADDPNRTIMATVGGADPHLKNFDKLAATYLYGAAGHGGVFQGDASGSNSVLSSWSWNAATETATLVGKGVDDSIRGTSVTDLIYSGNGNDKLFGLNGNDTLNGGAGNDFLDGGSGVDTMVGGLGDDTYFVDNTSDKIIEKAGQGNDWVYATASYTLGNNLETLQMFGDGLTGNGNNGANTLFGDGTFATTLNGYNGDDYIVGGAAADSLHGGNDNDTMYGQDGDDLVNGDAGNDFIHGDAGADKLNGGTGNDTIYGGLGHDTLAGSAGLDTFVFDTAASNANYDRILDFAVADDHIAFDHTVFAALQTEPSSSTLAASNFHIGTGATTADQHVIYDSGAGKLYYDADGNGAGAQQLVTTLTAGLALTNAHFLVF